ncbi:hypothetical protein H0I76_11945 [Limibaculum sp. M0105]|uniref:Uncharacterized protein n=1 Tax=Thermohalobaculum xanthum TaxID=2753746 RepID=A0A8J7SHT2_9RHOB|nr:hypothetical protein [Thermohalobaculum xanthum]MBK0399905.1 hypothetical protein [Thermohalobaculum xanthum]
MRSPFSSFRGEQLAGIGHNQGPPIEPGRSFRRHAWTVARRELLPKLPLEIIRRRVARAKELGLAYPAYASVLLGSGRDIVGFLFTCDALGLRLAQTLELPGPTVDKLRGLARCDRLLLAEPGDDPEVLRRALSAGPRIDFAAAGRAPLPPAPLPAGRAAIRAVLDPLSLPSDAVVMIGTRGSERAWADAARLAKFLPAESYFGGEAASR